VNRLTWNETWKAYREFNYKKLRRIYDILEIDTLPRDSKILDLGCGSGEFIRILQEQGFASVEGLEPDPNLVELANMPCVRQGDCLSQPATTAVYDAVIISGVLHHLQSVDDVVVTLKNVRSLLRPRGYFFSVEPRDTLARTVATKLMLTLPIWMLPSMVKIDRILVQEEEVELNRWLGFERTVPSKAMSLGLRVKKSKSDWKSTYLIMVNP
jgi:2-polyprenyl-3-methyl-5-hydroxy-6-metoxy-1,4-benzoquinol methylase